MAIVGESSVRPALIKGEKTYHDITEDICRPVEQKPCKDVDRIHFYYRIDGVVGCNHVGVDHI